MPHPWKNGSGVATQSQHQRLEVEGRQPQSGQRMPLNASSWSGSDTLTVISSDARPSFKNICSGIRQQLPQDQYGGQDGGHHQRLHVHVASLTSNLAALGRISNWLRTLVHVAQTARREFDSSLTPTLKETQRGDPEG
jgi:hypothetical protein